MTDGRHTNPLRHKFVSRVREQLENRGYSRLSPKVFLDITNNVPCFSTRCAIGETIYGTTRKVDFILRHPTLWPDCLVIRCKWQAKSGSVDEKFPYEVACINHLPYPTIIVLDGHGYQSEAKAWLVNQIKCGGNLKQVYDMREFARFCSRGGI